MGRFETEWLATGANRAALTDLSGTWIDRVHERRPPEGIILDMDSSESPTFGQQEGSAWNGHFGCTCYHPLFVFNQFGDLERCALRPGNVHSAEGWRDVLEPVIARYCERGCALYVRGDAGFAKPELYELLEAERIGYAIRLRPTESCRDRAPTRTRPLRWPYRSRPWRGRRGEPCTAIDEKGQSSPYRPAARVRRLCRAKIRGVTHMPIDPGAAEEHGFWKKPSPFGECRFKGSDACHRPGGY
jgi:Transposase DDE domain group 1